MFTLAVRSLGELALPDLCPRCFWLQEKLQGKLPFRIGMPGIFREIDSHVKQLVRSTLDRDGTLPPWFPNLGGEIVAYLPEEALDWWVFSHHDEETGIKLRGVPDEVFKLADGSYHIVDYKTARITDRQDELLPLYEAQLNAYAFIAQRIGYSPVTRLWLLYLEPQAGRATSAGPPELALSFAPVLHSIALDEGLVFKLLHRAQELLRLERPPVGRDGCEHCRQLERLMELLHEPLPF
jgi:hypothetical protein